MVGRSTFIGAGTTLTDYKQVDRPIRSFFGGKLENTGMTAIGGAVGHNVRIGSGMVIFPARMIDSDVILFATAERQIIRKNVLWDESDHLKLEQGETLHPRLYPRD